MAGAPSSRGAPRVAAVMVHHGDPSPTLRAIRSVRASRGVDLLLAVVDHGPGSGDALREAAREVQALYICPPVNSGFAAGLNRGLEAVRARGGAELFLLLNHDVELEEGAVLRLARRFREEPAVGVVGPAFTYVDRPEVVWNGGSEIDWPAGRPRSLFHGRLLEELPREPYPVGFVAGCALMLRPQILDRIGPLSEEYFLYFEDAELCSRVRQAGYEVKVEPRALARHQPGSAVRGHPALAAYCRARNRLHFSRRWAPAGPGARLARLRFALGRMLHGGAERRGALDGLRGAMGPPPAEYLARRNLAQGSFR